jgi:hypothetical protein
MQVPDELKGMDPGLAAVAVVLKAAGDRILQSALESIAGNLPSRCRGFMFSQLEDVTGRMGLYMWYLSELPNGQAISVPLNTPLDQDPGRGGMKRAKNKPLLRDTLRYTGPNGPNALYTPGKWTFVGDDPSWELFRRSPQPQS